MKASTQPILSLAAVGGHPLHPMMVHFPVAALLALVGADLAYVHGGDPFWSRAALWLAGVGAVGGWVAGVAGLVDLLGVPRVRNLITAWGHALVAVTMLAMATLNWRLRLGVDPGLFVMPWGLGMSVFTAGFISLASYLGGRLVYENAVGVHTEE